MVTYFGPVTAAPSWTWVGGDVAELVGMRRKVQLFATVDEIPRRAVTFWVKAPPVGTDLMMLIEREIRIVFLPVDYFQNDQHIAQHAVFSNYCCLIVLHSTSLSSKFDPAKLRFVDHYNKYGVDPASRQPGTKLLWIGGFQYAPYVARFLLDTNLHARHPVVILSDLDNPSAQRAAENLANRLDVARYSDAHALSKLVTVERWSEYRQAELLHNCRAAFDIKAPSNFNQFHKPPTKLQKYICSAIPAAINGGMPLVNAFKFELPEPTALDVWLGPAYAEQIRQEANHLRKELSRQSIAQRYMSFICEAEQ